MNEKKKASNQKWDAANLKRLSLAIPITLYERMKKHTEATNKTVNGFIRESVEAMLEMTGIEE